jgi:hypothetical protein
MNGNCVGVGTHGNKSKHLVSQDDHQLVKTPIKRAKKQKFRDEKRPNNWQPHTIKFSLDFEIGIKNNGIRA